MELVDRPTVQSSAADLAEELKSRSAADAAARLASFSGLEIAAVLMRLSPGFAQDVLGALPDEARERALAAAPPEVSRQWQRNALYEPDAIGRMMEPVLAAFSHQRTVGETIEQLREMVKSALITYVYVVDPAEYLLGIVQDTIDRLVILALFLPVLAGQSGNTGCQALAVTLRGLTLGELKPGAERALVTKEAWLGCLNGAGVGLFAGLGMYITATGQESAHPVMLALVVFLAMIGSCIASGISGAMVPLTLKRLGFDPATASSIFLTTATDVVSMGMLLGLATMMVR